MRLSTIRDIALSLMIIICLGLIIHWLNSSSDKKQAVTEKTIKGLPEIVDADSFFIRDQEIRLFGIDAPEGKQFCKTEENKTYPCGRKSSQALKKLINSKAIECRVRSWDRYNRAVSICYLGKTDINDWLVRRGWALAYRKYSQNYVSAEQQAQNDRLGLWRGKFMEPWQWRHIHNPR